jgi:hypothetical protein
MAQKDAKALRRPRAAQQDEVLARELRHRRTLRSKPLPPLRVAAARIKQEMRYVLLLL